MNAEARQKIMLKVQALLAKTVENGCTEEEAMSAAELASRLMAEYNLARDDVQSVRTDRYGIRVIEGLRTGVGKGHKWHAVYNTIWTLQAFCNVRIFTTGAKVQIFGSQEDTEFAKYLIFIIKDTMDREVQRFLIANKGSSQHGHALRTSFLNGMSSRINQRLAQIIAQRDAEMKSTPTGRDLVVVKNQEVERRFNDLNLNLKTTSRKTTNSSHSAYHAGVQAGDKVGFGRPVGSAEGAKRLN